MGKLGLVLDRYRTEDLRAMNYSEGGGDIIIKEDHSDWSVVNTTGDEDVVYLGSETVVQAEPEDPRWSLNTILIISLGPLGVVLLVSYIVHWYQVAQKVLANRRIREMKEEEVMQHPKASAMLSIRALERETGGTFMDMAVDKHDEYGIQLTKDFRLAR